MIKQVNSLDPWRTFVRQYIRTFVRDARAVSEPKCLGNLRLDFETFPTFTTDEAFRLRIALDSLLSRVPMKFLV